jgi:serine/threonine protein kinase
MQNYIGQQIDSYRITERLGMGGMAVVYKAYDTRLERDVALKLIRTGSIPPDQYDRLMKRFEREAKSQARFDHKHIVHVYDYGEAQGAPYLVMSYVPGGTLKAKTGQPVDYRQAFHWLLPVADALAYAHKRGVIHRDIKPSNILIDEEDQPVLTDFGIAKILETDEATLTGTGLGVGTPEYMAPEQWQGKASPATDQYSLGVVLYELITGQKPYSADTPAAIILMQATEPLCAPSQLVDGVPEGLEKVLYKALARNPQDRYEDMAAFLDALGAVVDRSEAPEQVRVDKSSAKSMASPVVAELVDSEGLTWDVLDRNHNEYEKGLDQNEPVEHNNYNKKRNLSTTFIVLSIIFSILGIALILFYILATVENDNKNGHLPQSPSENIQLISDIESTPSFTVTLTMSLTPTKYYTITPSVPYEYEVQEGDNCFSIAETFEVNIEVLLILNNLTSGCFIAPGQTILIPAPGQMLPTATPLPSDVAPGTVIEYQVKPGDSLTEIAELLLSSVERIIEETNKYRRIYGLDEMNDANDMYVGDILIIPVHIVTPIPSKTLTNTPVSHP